MSIQLAQAATGLIVKVTILLAAGLPAGAVMRRRSAERRHPVLLVTVGSAVLLPVALAVVPRWSFPLLPPTTQASDVIADQRSVVVVSPPAMPVAARVE